jgi:hypothetical protein
MAPITHAVGAVSPASSEPAGGAAMDQVAIATGFATLTTAALLWVIFRYRAGGAPMLRRVTAAAERLSGLPAWAALPAGLSGASLLVALLGMYWDISLHIDQGRDPGPLANPAHYLILVGLYGVFAAGVLAISLPEGPGKPSASAIRLGRDWYAPVGGVLTAACGAFALIGFPLDDMWHRLFGQDVTLWGPTHLMLFGGAGLSLIGQAILLAEGMKARGKRADRLGQTPFVTALRRVGLMGGLLIGLSTFQGEFDFGVPQFRMVFHPLLIALAAAMALTAARVWIGRGGALAAAVFFLAIRGTVALIVGPVFGETTPALPLYLVEALCVEAVGLWLGRSRPIALGAVGGLLCGTVGVAAEWVWVDHVFPLPWNGGIVPEALVLAAIAGVAGGVLGGLLGSGLRFELPRAARPAALAAFAAIALVVADGLATKSPEPGSVTVALRDVQPAPDRMVQGTVTLNPRDRADDAAWISMTAWQGGGLHVDRLKRVAQGVYRTTEPIPVYKDWKAVVRVHRGRELAAVPVYLPEDAAIPARQVSATGRFTRPFVSDEKVLQRERKTDIPGWLWTTACLVVLSLALVFMATLAWGLARVARSDDDVAAEPPAEPRDRAGRFRIGTPTVGAGP